MAANIITAVLSAVTLVLLGVTAWNFATQEDYSNHKTVNLEDMEEEAQVNVSHMSVKLTGLAPGMSSTYTIRLEADDHQTFQNNLVFRTVKRDSLAPFVVVTVSVNDKQVDSAVLADYLAGREIDFDVTFDETDTAFIKIMYTMPEETGDEAQNTAADFEMVLTSRR